MTVMYAPLLCCHCDVQLSVSFPQLVCTNNQAGIAFLVRDTYAFMQLSHVDRHISARNILTGYTVGQHQARSLHEN